MKRPLSIHDIDKNLTERMKTHFPALRTVAQCIKAKLNCDTFETSNIVIGVIINFQWFIKLQGRTGQNPTVVYTATYF